MDRSISGELDFAPVHIRSENERELAHDTVKDVHVPMTTLVPRRKPHKMRDDRAAFESLLNGTVLVHIGVVADGRAVTFPTAFVRVGNELVVHGSTGSRWMRMLTSQEVSATVTRLDGIVVARSTFESSMHYRSAMIFGTFTEVTGDRKRDLVDRFSDRLIPGRTREVRPSTKKELAATAVLAMPLDTWSMRVSDSWPDDGPDDLDSSAWAGVVRPVRLEVEAVTAPDLRNGIPVPPSVQELLTDPGRTGW